MREPEVALIASSAALRPAAVLVQLMESLEAALQGILRKPALPGGGSLLERRKITLEGAAPPPNVVRDAGLDVKLGSDRRARRR
jgi:hypothetical protein